MLPWYIWCAVVLLWEGVHSVIYSVLELSAIYSSEPVSQKNRRFPSDAVGVKVRYSIFNYLHRLSVTAIVLNLEQDNGRRTKVCALKKTHQTVLY